MSHAGIPCRTGGPGGGVSLGLHWKYFGERLFGPLGLRSVSIGNGKYLVLNSLFYPISRTMTETMVFIGLSEAFDIPMM